MQGGEDRVGYPHRRPRSEHPRGRVSRRVLHLARATGATTDRLGDTRRRGRQLAVPCQRRRSTESAAAVSFDTIAGSPVGTRMLDHLVFDGFAGARPLTDLSEAALYELVTRAAVELSSEKWSTSPGRFWPWEER